MLKAALELQLSKLPPNCLRIGSVGAGRSIDLVISGSDARMNNFFGPGLTFKLQLQINLPGLMFSLYNEIGFTNAQNYRKPSREQFPLRKELPKKVPPPWPFLTVM